MTRLSRFFGLFALLLCALAFAPGAQAAPTFPKLTGRVVDEANIIPQAQETQLTQYLAALEKQSGRQVVVVTLPSLQGYDVADYGYQLGRAWGIGQEDTNNGALLIVAPNERKVRIEVGYGLEPILTDGMSRLIIDENILPAFKQDNYPAGIMAGTQAIGKLLTLPPEEAQKLAAQADHQQSERSGGGGVGTIIFILVILFFVVMPMVNEARGGRGRRRRSGPGFIWIPGGGWGNDDDHWGGGGGFGGGGFGGGGGFSGGGGSFGGGGASGSW